MPDRCPWCDGEMTAGKNRGKPRRFCSQLCKRAYESAARRFVDSLANSGHVPPGWLRAWMAAQQTRAFISVPNSPDAASEHPNAPSDALGPAK